MGDRTSNSNARVLAILICILAAFIPACSKKPDVKTELNHLEQAFPDSKSNDFIGVALTAIRKADYAEGVIALDSVKRVPGVTAAQLMTIQNAMQAITTDLLARAARGEAQAQVALAAIERSRSQ